MTVGAVKNSTSAALDKLEAMEDPDRIADFFRSRRILGHPKHATECPVARYLLDETGAHHVVGPDRAHRLRIQDDELDGDRCDLPACVTAFIIRMDHGYYPFLVRSDPT